VLNGLRPSFSGPDPDGFLNREDEDLPVTNLALAVWPGACGDGEHLDDPIDDLGSHDSLDLQAWP
jgi:hypothetical protein